MLDALLLVSDLLTLLPELPTVLSIRNVQLLDNCQVLEVFGAILALLLFF